MNNNEIYMGMLQTQNSYLGELERQSTDNDQTMNVKKKQVIKQELF